MSQYPPSVQARAHFKSLDLVTSEAVHELGAALRRVRELERADLSALSVVGRSDHHRKLSNAIAKRKAAREALDLLLEES